VKRFLAIGISVMMILSLLASCGPGSTVSTATSNSNLSTTSQSTKKITIAFCYQDLATEFWVATHTAIVETLKAKGVEVIERNANTDANKQLEQVKDVIAQKVDGILIIPQDGDSAVTIGKVCNDAGIPVGICNRPPTNHNSKYLVVLSDELSMSYNTVTYMMQQAKKLGRKVTPCIMVGDLGDPNAVNRRNGFLKVIEENPDVFNKVIEVPTKWDANTALANLKSAMQANPDIDFLFTSSDFMYPQIQAVLEPLGKWKPIGDAKHVIMGGIDGDAGAAKLMDNKYVDATGGHDLYGQAKSIMDELLKAIESGNKTPDNWMPTAGVILTQDNMTEKRMLMWGNILRKSKGEIN